MATVQQTITLTVLPRNPALPLTATEGGVIVVPITLSPTSQRFPVYYDVLTLNTTAMKYLRAGAEVGDINPLILAGADGSDIPALVIADLDAMTAAGVFNL